MKRLKYWNLVLLAILMLNSCKEDSIPTTHLTVDVEFPKEVSLVDSEGVEVTLTNQSTGTVYNKSTDVEGSIIMNIPEGVYNVTANTKREYTTEAGEQSYTAEGDFVANIQNYSVAGKTQDLSLTLAMNVNNNTWVFKEIYFKGSKTSEDKKYGFDKYFSIVNNSNEVLYADGLSIAESFVITSKDVYLLETPVNRNEAFIAQLIYMIPGGGTDYPVQPGEQIILADNPIDHTAVNPNSYDLSMANFEWYDDYRDLDTDVPEVTNLIKVYSRESIKLWRVPNLGNRSYVIFKFNEDADKYKNQNEIEVVNGSGKTLKVCKVNNDIIIDAVELSKKDAFKQKVLAPTLDMGYTFCGLEEYGKCVRRKVEKEVDGRKIYQDTNNSSVDFDTDVIPMPAN